MAIATSYHCVQNRRLQVLGAPLCVAISTIASIVLYRTIVYKIDDCKYLVQARKEMNQNVRDAHEILSSRLWSLYVMMEPANYKTGKRYEFKDFNCM